jgi:hypothetical protein
MSAMPHRTLAALSGLTLGQRSCLVRLCGSGTLAGARLGFRGWAGSSCPRCSSPDSSGFSCTMCGSAIASRSGATSGCSSGPRARHCGGARGCSPCRRAAQGSRTAQVLVWAVEDCSGALRRSPHRSSRDRPTHSDVHNQTSGARCPSKALLSCSMSFGDSHRIGPPWVQLFLRPICYGIEGSAG